MTPLKERPPVFLKVVRSFMFDGQKAREGDIVEVPEQEAVSLLSRGRVVLATEDDMPAEEPQQPEAEPVEEPATTSKKRKKK